MLFEQELEDKGFKHHDNFYWYLFSDFETLEFTAEEWDCADGTKAIAISNLEIVDHINTANLLSINYTLYFRDINKFYELLTLLNYKI